MHRPRPDRIALQVGNDTVLIRIQSISHMLYDGSLVSISTTDSVYLSELSLHDLMDRVGGDPFHRVHRRAIVNLDHVERLRGLSSGGYIAVMNQGAEVAISRAAARELRRILNLR
jgi:two-component system LytT family response regulator